MATILDVFAFTRLRDEDLPTLHRWLNDPAVVRWWEGADVSWSAVRRDYDPQLSGPIEHWIASIDTDVGWLQCYAAVDNPEESEHWWQCGIDRNAAGIDYLVGNPALRGSGVGSSMIRAFVIEVVFGRHPQWSQVCAGPFAANVASWRALEKAGFVHVGTIDDEEGPCRLMVLDRSTVAFA